MRRTTLALLLVSLTFVGACEDKEPSRSLGITTSQEDENVGSQVDQTPPQTCLGEETDETPEFDAAVSVTGTSKRMDFHISVAEKKGLEVCTLLLRIRHHALDEESGEWKRDGQSSLFLIPRISPGEIYEKVTAVREPEYPEVNEPGPPEAWSITVERYHEVRRPAS